MFLQCRLAMKPDGLFLAAILGGETLKLSTLCLFVKTYLDLNFVYP